MGDRRVELNDRTLIFTLQKEKKRNCMTKEFKILFIAVSLVQSQEQSAEMTPSAQGHQEAHIHLDK